MVRVAILAATLLLVARTNVHAKPPIMLSECGTITQPGKYAFASNLILIESSTASGGSGGDCLIVASPHVSIDMQGHLIDVACVPDCIYGAGNSGGTGLHILSGADYVSVSNGYVEDFLYAIVAEADHTSVNNIATNASNGITLNNNHHSVFTNISFSPASNDRYLSGYMVLDRGGSFNNFTNLKGAKMMGLTISNSSHELVDQASVEFGAEAYAGPGILLTQDSRYNVVTNSNVLGSLGNGIEVDVGSGHNQLEGNTVSVLYISGLGLFDMLDENPDCDHNVWIGNSFTSASPASCIN